MKSSIYIPRQGRCMFDLHTKVQMHREDGIYVSY